MREVIAVCRSKRHARERVARTLDRYFWRVGDRTWRGKATNACMDRVSRELRKGASRHTAVTIQDARRTRESRAPLVRIGNRHAFGADGASPVASHPAQYAATRRPPHEAAARAILLLAAVFHDTGKASRLFQDKLRRSLRPNRPLFGEADPVRHELMSAFLWDELFGEMDDASLIRDLRKMGGAQVAAAWDRAADRALAAHGAPDDALRLAFAGDETRITGAVGHLILGHHRLPDGSHDTASLKAGRHVSEADLSRQDLEIAPGRPFWDGTWCRETLQRAAGDLYPGAAAEIASVDMGLRTALMLADHLGSARKTASDPVPDHLANTHEGAAMDDLETHTRRVTSGAGRAWEMLYPGRGRFPALDGADLPVDILHPAPADEAFQWQSRAAEAAGRLAASGEGGFFGCLLAGTGTGKTRGAPTVLAAAALGDKIPSRRQVRFTLGLGLRVLATQSAREYVDDLGFSDRDVSVVVGQAPVRFAKNVETEAPAADGSESLIALPDWLRVEMADGGVPLDGAEGEEAWLRSLSTDTSRMLPPFCDQVLRKAGKRAAAGRRLIEPPVTVCTIDHLMGVASPRRSSHLLGAVRAMTSDLILDEIDQYGPEDIAAISRLVYQVGAAGGRVIAMSATMTPGIAQSLHAAYARGWSRHAAETGRRDHVHLLCSGDTPRSCHDNADGAAPEEVIGACVSQVLGDVAGGPAKRPSAILPPCAHWEDLVAQVDGSCSELHADNHVTIEGMAVSFGLLRLTRISHTAAMAVQLPAGPMGRTWRAKICLHSTMPRLQRSWIEDRLRGALTRKGAEPVAGLAAFCEEEGLIAKARAAGCDSLEIVLVASPVVETGNDLDFDWGILDPVSTRSVIQSGGRIRRHRAANGAVNTHVLGRALTAMKSGRLMMPGIETRNDAAGIRVPDLQDFEGRHTADLFGPAGLPRVDSALMLDRGRAVPLRDAEIGYCDAMISHAARTPMSRYTGSLQARMSLSVPRQRTFRRSVAHDIVYTLDGPAPETAAWHIDLAPGTRESHLEPAEGRGFTRSEEPVTGYAFQGDVLQRALEAYLDGRGAPGRREMQGLFEVRLAEYGEPDTLPRVCLHPFTGLTRGDFERLAAPFGAAR